MSFARHWRRGCRCSRPMSAIIRGWLPTENAGFCSIRSDPRTIVTAIKSLIALTPNDWRKFSFNARQYAVENLDIEKMITAYENLFVKLLASRRRKSNAS